MLCEKGLCEVHKIRYDLIACVRPKGSELKGVACFRLFAVLACLFDGIETSGIGIIFCIRAIGNNEYLHVLKQS